MHCEERQIAKFLSSESHKEEGGCIEGCRLCVRFQCLTEDTTHLDTSGLQHGASVLGTSKSLSSLAAHSHVPPAVIQKEWVARSIGTCGTAGNAVQAANQASLCAGLTEIVSLTFRQGTFPRGFMDRYSSLRCFFLCRATGLSSTGRFAHLHIVLHPCQSWLSNEVRWIHRFWK